MSALTLEQILKENQQFSQLSQQPSFTLTDILEQPLDQQLIQDNQIGQDDMDCFFDDDQNQQQNQQPKIYQFYKQSSNQLLYKQSSNQQFYQQFYKQSKSQQIQVSESLKSPDIIRDNDKPQAKVLNSITSKNSLRVSGIVQQVKRHERLKSMSLIPFQQINNMSFVILKNVTNLFEDSKNISFGIPTAIAATTNRFLAVGSSMGNIAIFQIGIKGFKTLGTSEQRKFGAITCLSISKDNKYLVSGYESGLIAIWDLAYFSLFKQELATRSKITQVLFCSQTFQTFVTNDIDGNLYLYTIQKYIWSSLKYQRLIQNTSTIFYDIRYHELQTKNSLLALCSLDFVLLIGIKPDVKVIGKIVRPDGIGLNYVPNVQMARCKIQGANSREQIQPFYDVLFVSWGKNIYIYRFVPSVNGYQQIDQLFVYTHPSSVYNIQYLSQNLLMTLDNHQIFRTIRVDFNLSKYFFSYQQSQRNRKMPQISCEIINTRQMTQQIIYQRFVKDKQNKYLKSFTNTVINCTNFGLINSLGQTEQFKQTFFITKNCIYRSRLHKWNSFLFDLINQQKNLKMALKAAIQLKNQNLNIFSQKVQLFGKKGQKNINTFCELGKIFIQQGLKSIKRSNLDRVKNMQRHEVQIKQIQSQLRQLYEYTIQYFISIKCQQYLFNIIYSKIIKNLPSFEYWQLFIESLKPFITGQILRRIPNLSVFKQILDYLSATKSFSVQQDNMKLIDQMILNLQPESLHYEQTVSLLTQNRLYTSLSYICSIHQDFISPCNKLLMKILQTKKNQYFNAQEEYFGILKIYLNRLLEGCYLNQKLINKKVFQQVVVRDVGNWLSFQDTMHYFLQVNNNKFQSYLTWVYRLLEQMTKSKDQNLFHQLFNHYIQALQKMQIWQKNDKKHSIQRKNIFIYQLALMIQKFGNIISLKSQQIKFFMNVLYKSKVTKCQQSQYIIFTKIQLSEELLFILKYFQSLHSVQLQSFQSQNDCFFAFQYICSQKNGWVKYFYNFMVKNINKYITNENKLIIKNSVENSNEKSISSEPCQRSLLGLLYTQQRQPLCKYQRQPLCTQQRQTKGLKSFNEIKIYNLKQIQTKIKIEDLQTPESILNNTILSNFIIDNIQLKQIDANIQNLLKISSQIFIVYMLQNYDIERVNQKIQKINDLQVKYSVVRRIIKRLRKSKEKQQQILRKPIDEPIVWGNKHRSFKKKQQQLNKPLMQTSLLNPKAHLSKQGMLFYITSLGKYKRQKRVYSQLKNHLNQYKDYLPQILEFAQKRQLNSCIGLVYLQMKQYVKAIEFYQLVYNERFQVNLQHLALVQYCHGRFLRQIFNQMLNICQTINQQQQWLKLLEVVLAPLMEDNRFQRRKKQKVIQLIQKVYDAHPSQTFIVQLGQVIQLTLLQVSSKLTLHQISKMFNEYSQLMNKTYMLSCLKSTMHTYSKSIFIYQISNQMVLNDQAHEFDTIYYQHKIKGINYVPICQNCIQKVKFGQKALVYRCGHVYHRHCLENRDKCVKCVLIEVGQSRESVFSFREDTSTSNNHSSKVVSQNQPLISPLSIQQSNQDDEPTGGQVEQEKVNLIYKCLAFEDYLAKDELKFQQFRKDYDGYLAKYQ